jgi:hypothetical protein
MDFVSRLSGSKKGNDVIWVIVDQLSKFALFLPIKLNDYMDKLVRLYVNEVVRLNGVLVSIIVLWRPTVQFKVWPSIQYALSTKLNLRLFFIHRQMVS